MFSPYVKFARKGMKPFALIIGASRTFYCWMCCLLQRSWNSSDLWCGQFIYHSHYYNGASSLEFGKLVAASFLYRHWNTCNRTLRTYLLLAVGLLVCITSAGIYGYLSQAFEETLSQVEGYEKEIVSLQRASKVNLTGLFSHINYRGRKVRSCEKKSKVKKESGLRGTSKRGERHHFCRAIEGKTR